MIIQIEIPDDILPEVASSYGYAPKVRKEEVKKTPLKKNETQAKIDEIVNKYYSEGAVAVAVREDYVQASFLSYIDNTETAEDFLKNVFLEKTKTGIENRIFEKKEKEEKENRKKEAKEKVKNISILK